MGRQWWYDSYWEKKKPARRGFQMPRRQLWVWIALIVLAILLAASNTGFQPVAMAWLVGFLYYLCRIFIYAIIIRAILSWFVRSRQNLILILLDDITQPLLSPLRRVIPRLGVFDLSPLIAIGILYLISFLFGLLLA
ncbi:YggT family protein [Chloroflexota bacterium]